MDVDGDGLRAALGDGRFPGPHLRPGPPDPRVAAARAAAVGPPGRAAPAQRPHRDRLPALAARAGRAHRRLLSASVRLRRTPPHEWGGVSAVHFASLYPTARIEHVNSAPLASAVRNPRRWPTRDLQPFSLRAHGDPPGEQTLGQARRRQPGPRVSRAPRIYRARRPLLRHRAAGPSDSALAA